MAQTKRKRRTKHRGTPAGTIEARGRTGRPPTQEERKRQARSSARDRRLNNPPTWRSSLTRASLAATCVFLFLLVTSHGKSKIVASVSLALVAFAVYIPAGYYLELFLYRRRQRKKQAGA